LGWPQLRASQLREAEAVEGGSIALMEAEEARARLRRAENRVTDMQTEVSENP
jgi:cob(I)alamin adenosyltransferase